MNTPTVRNRSRAALDVGDARVARGLIALLLVIFIAGFAKNFYLRAWLGTRPLILTAWVHGILMTGWIVLFALQVAMAARGRLDLHRRFGRWGIGLAIAVLAVGIVTILVRTRLMYPAAAASTSALVFVAFDGLSLLLFAALVGLAWKYRSRPALHRRLMTMAVVALLPPAFGRIVAYLRHDHIEIAVVGLMAATVVAFLVADTWRSGRLQSASWMPGLAILLVNWATYAAQVAT
jgi:hypothetical protein